MKDFFIILLVKIINIAIKLFGKNGGNVLGKIANKLDKNIIKYFKIDCPVIAVTATNRKNNDKQFNWNYF